MSKQTKVTDQTPRHVGFIYVQTRAPHKAVCADASEAVNYYGRNKRWKHTATLDPHAWLTYLMNHPQEREAQIENLFSARTLIKQV